MSLNDRKRQRVSGLGSNTTDSWQGPIDARIVPAKYCFVTIGATTTFDALVERILTTDFVTDLKDHGYTHLVIQYGNANLPLFKRLLEGVSQDVRGRIEITGFDSRKDGLEPYMLLARREVDQKTGKLLRDEGMVIGHAGSGTILDAMRLDVPLVVVPNSTLLHNHQVELAEVLASQGYVVHGTLDDLEAAIGGIAALRKRHSQLPPVNSGQHRQTSRGFMGVIDDEAGFLD